jgi:hypothetical protein
MTHMETKESTLDGELALFDLLLHMAEKHTPDEYFVFIDDKGPAAAIKISYSFFDALVVIYLNGGGVVELDDLHRGWQHYRKHKRPSCDPDPVRPDELILNMHDPHFESKIGKLIKDITGDHDEWYNAT